MFWTRSSRPSGAIVVGNLAGTYSVYDDGWPGRLKLALSGDSLKGSFYSYRFRSHHDVSIVVGERAPHHVSVTIHGAPPGRRGDPGYLFNELPQQTLDGWFFTRSANGMAGRTDWKGETFGWFARKSRPRCHTVHRSDPITAADFAGAFSVYCDGSLATLRLNVAGDAEVRGSMVGPGGTRALDVTGRIGSPSPHVMSLLIHGVEGPDEPPAFTGYLFTRPRNAVAGELLWDGVAYGCYLTRFA